MKRVRSVISQLLLMMILFPFVAVASQLKPSDIYRQESRSVVLVYGMNNGAQTWSKGTGSFIKHGYVLTNAHVILDHDGKPLDVLAVYLKPKEVESDLSKNLTDRREAVLVKYNRALDLALLEIKDAPEVPPIQLGDSSAVEIGDPVLAIGHPESGGLWSLTSGKIGSILMNFEKIEGKDVFQSEASINRGNSGGPLLDYDGRLIGINTSTIRKAADGFTITGINFSVQSLVAQKWLAGIGVEVPIVRHEMKEEARIIPPEKALPAQLPPAREEPKKSPSTAKVEPPAAAPHKKDDAKETPSEKDTKKEGEILTPKHPYAEKDLFDRLMEAKENEIDRQMEKMDKDF
jgi:serine protease Do